MASYATEAQFRQYMDANQVADNATTDALIAEVLERATSDIDNYLWGKPDTNFFGGYEGAASAHYMSLNGGATLALPYYQAGTITAIELVDYQQNVTHTFPTTEWFAEDDDHTRIWRGGGWPAGRYKVTAKWGHGDAPANVVQICLEVAINYWLSRSKSMQGDVLGVGDQGAIRVSSGGLTKAQRDRLDIVRSTYAGWGIA